MLAALLSKADVAEDLLPLLAEPVRLALDGVSIMSRRRHPHHTLAFLRALRELAKGVQSESSGLLLRSRRRVLDHYDAFVLSQLQEEFERTFQGLSPAKESTAASSPEQQLPKVDVEEIRSYFQEKQRRRTQQNPRSREFKDPQGDADEEEDGNGTAPEEHGKPTKPGAVCYLVRAGGLGTDRRHRTGIEHDPDRAALRETLDEDHRRIYAAAILASSICDAAAPLVASKDIRVTLAALEVVVESLLALQWGVDANDIGRDLASMLRLKRKPLSAPLPQIPPLYPSVAGLWPFFITALKDDRSLVVERALLALASVAHITGGDFLAHRFHREAWPLLLRLLQGGRPISGAQGQGTKPLGGFDGGSAAEAAERAAMALQATSTTLGTMELDIAPGTQQRLRRAVLACLEQIATLPESDQHFHHRASSDAASATEGDGEAARSRTVTSDNGTDFGPKLDLGLSFEKLLEDKRWAAVPCRARFASPRLSWYAGPCPWETRRAPSDSMQEPAPARCRAS